MCLDVRMEDLRERTRTLNQHPRTELRMVQQSLRCLSGRDWECEVGACCFRGRHAMSGYDDRGILAVGWGLTSM